MPTDNDQQPTIEVRVITFLALLEHMGDLGPSPGVIAESRGASRKRRRRKATGLTLEQLAERLLQTLSYTDEFENRRSMPKLSEMVELARKLGVPPGELYGLRPDFIRAADGLFKPVPLDIQNAVLTILRSVSKPPKDEPT